MMDTVESGIMLNVLTTLEIRSGIVQIVDLSLELSITFFIVWCMHVLNVRF